MPLSRPPTPHPPTQTHVLQGLDQALASPAVMACLQQLAQQEQSGSPLQRRAEALLRTIGVLSKVMAAARPVACNV